MKLRKAQLVTAALLLVLMAASGCRGSDAPVSYMDEGFQDLGSPQSKPLPGLELINPTSIDTTTATSPGMVLKPGTYAVVLSGDSVESAQWQEDLSTGLPVLTLRFDPDGAETLNEWTSEHIGESLPIALDGRVIMAPQILEPIADGSLMLSTDDPSGFEQLESVVSLPR